MNGGVCVCVRARAGLAAQAVLAAPWAYTVGIRGHLVCQACGAWQQVVVGGSARRCMQPAVAITCRLQVVQDCQLRLWL